MKHVMIDIETLGVKEDAVIATLAAVEFDFIAKKTGESLYLKIDITDSIYGYDRKVDSGTIAWWMTQDEKAKSDIFINPNRIRLRSALDELQEFIPPKALIWANSPQFDLRILSHAYESFGEKAPWEYWQERDFRTIKHLFPYSIKAQASQLALSDNPFTAHNAYYDCLFQAEYLIKVCEILNITPQ